MSIFDKIIGYSDIKSELEQLADVLKGNEMYKKLGVKPPKGLLLCGDPGLGKTLMADCLIRASGRIWFTCRKDLPNREFVKHLRETFLKAKNAAPSIVFLDDMDKFANEDIHHRNAEEYVAVQSCIDEAKDWDVFVVATANDVLNMPDSLLRAGRFDRVIEVERPSGEDAEAIMAHYAKGRPLSEDLDGKLVSRLLDNCSCAELETVINEAGLYAGFDRSAVVKTDHFLKACLKQVHELPAYALNHIGQKTDDRSKGQVALHEAGHVVVSEVLDPGSVSMAVIYKAQPDSTFSGLVTTRSSQDVLPLERKEIKIRTALGGKAAVETVLGNHDVGADDDIDNAFMIVRHLVRDTCIQGFKNFSYRREDSQQLKYNQEMCAAEKVEEYYREVKRIIAQNQVFLERIAAELMEKDVLTLCDIARIKEEIQNKNNAA